MDLFLDTCIMNAMQMQSRCTAGMLSIEGMSGDKTRHLYNNVCGVKFIDRQTRYLEIGCWKGSSTVAALHRNKCLATVVDNWSEFGGPCDEFRASLDAHLTSAELRDTQILDEDCFGEGLGAKLAHAPYDVYLYDGHHSLQSHTDAIVKMWEHLADTCIVMVDDFNWPDVRKGTMKGLEQVGAKILSHRVIESPESDGKGFWNGCGLFLCRKSSEDGRPDAPPRQPEGHDGDQDHGQREGQGRAAGLDLDRVDLPPPSREAVLEEDETQNSGDEKRVVHLW